MSSAILFDFNGVLINDEPLHCEALIHTLAEFGIDLDRDTYYREYLGFDDRECFRYSFTRANRPADPDSIADATERKNAAYERRLRNSLPMVPGATDFVRAAAADGHRLAIVSGALRREIELVLSRDGIALFFDLIIAAEDVAACKPDPAGYNQARAALGVSMNECVAIEDSLPGLMAARAAGLRCAMLSTSHPADALQGADLVWEDFTGRRPAELPWANGHD
jgi:phosphoglycolate phosphatase